ncbi:Cu/Pi carrier [Metarhizium acridum]|uniref:Cu/Pi carrier n=1 Tax=Metarhizium acridum TaxID=92637 RepID=UPI001C6B7647|nr:Cu/Pi carrier [Metarhizium acridum]
MTGWSPTFFGYSAQGSFKYGWYEYFKKTYSDIAGPEAAYKYKTGLYLAASASAEFLADIALCPFEAVKVRMQGTIPNPYTGTLHGINTIVAKEGWAGLYKGLYPLWGRQIPYTMMKFASFETIVEKIYDRLPGQKSDYGKAAQTGVSFTGGYLAGILCAVVSHPADVMVSKLNAYRKPGEAFGTVISRIYGEIGFGGLWNGLPVRIVMIGTLTGLQWMIYVSFQPMSRTPPPFFAMSSLMVFLCRITSRFSWAYRPPVALLDLTRRNKQKFTHMDSRNGRRKSTVWKWEVDWNRWVAGLVAFQSLCF